MYSSSHSLALSRSLHDIPRDLISTKLFIIIIPVTSASSNEITDQSRRTGEMYARVTLLLPKLMKLAWKMLQ